MSKTENPEKTQEDLTSKLNQDIFNDFIEHHHDGGMIALGMAHYVKSKGGKYNNELKALVKQYNANLSKPDDTADDTAFDTDDGIIVGSIHDDVENADTAQAVATAENGTWIEVAALKSKDFTVFANPIGKREGIAYFKDEQGRVTFTTMKKLGLFYDAPRSKFLIV